MRVSDAKSLVGKIVTLDLLGGVRITTKIEAVIREETNPEWGAFTPGYYMHTGPLLVFLMGQQQDPKTGKVGFQLMGIMPYGIPEIAPQKKNVLDLNHIIMATEAQKGFADLYVKETSGIIPAGAGTPLPSLDDIGAAMAKVAGKS